MDQFLMSQLVGTPEMLEKLKNYVKNDWTQQKRLPVRLFLRSCKRHENDMTKKRVAEILRKNNMLLLLFYYQALKNLPKLFIMLLNLKKKLFI